MQKQFWHFNKLLDWVLESQCLLCDRSSAQTLCCDCQQRLQRCRLPQPQQFWQAPVPILPWGVYSGSLKRAIGVMKYQNQPQLAQPLGYWLAEAWRSTSIARTQAQRLTVVPIPMHATKQQQRGFNQAELLAEAFCRQTRLPLQRQGLVRVRQTEAQFNLGRETRQQNLADAFAVNGQWWRGEAVLLVDDIFTTGATLQAATQAFQAHQIPVYGSVVVARAGAMKVERSDRPQAVRPSQR